MGLSAVWWRDGCGGCYESGGLAEERQMAFKEVTSGTEIYWINTDQIAYVRKTPIGSTIQFGAAIDNKILSLAVNEAPEQILGTGILRTFQ